MAARALHTLPKLSIGLCALWLAATGCDDSSNLVVTDAGAPDGGDDNSNGGMNGEDNGDDNGEDSGGENGGFIGGGNNGMMPVAMLDDDVAGKACSSAADCEGENSTCADTIGGISIFGMTLGGQPAEGGYCSGACEMDSQCGEGGVCVGAFMTPLGNLPGSCQKACASDADCRTEEGYGCVSGGGGGMGMAPPQPSTCLPVPETVDLDDGVVGKACSADSDCAGGACITTLPSGGGMTEFPDGYCGGKCLDDADCGGTGVCIGVFSGFGSITPGDCYQACEDEAACTREGYSCAATQGVTGPGPLACQPDADVAGDAGAGDAGALDAGVLDAGALDAGAVDAGTLDAGAGDAGAGDAGAAEAGAGAVEAGAGAVEAGAGAAEAGAGDTGAFDAGA